MSCISYLCTICNYGFFDPPPKGPYGQSMCPLCENVNCIKALFDEYQSNL